MNTYNHHRILNEVYNKLFEEACSDKNLTDVFCEFQKYKSRLEAASDYADEWSFNQDTDSFFFYNFYYNIELEGEKQKNEGSIVMKRADANYKKAFIKCDLEDNAVSTKPSKYKALFSTINNRAFWLKSDFFDKSNQSDCVAFLHAMAASVKQGSEDYMESPDAAKKEFIKHLKKCFSEYLLLNDDKKATFMLGIALHGIMDSFTPSHMDFQPYAIQDMAFHAQGDVIPFRNDSVCFEPGQYAQDGVATNGKSKIAARIKGYDGDNEINNKEFEMFKIFSAISGISENEIVQSIIDKRIDISDYKLVFATKNSTKPVKVKYDSLKRLNDIIKVNNIKYSDTSYKYSDSAIEVVKEVFKTLCKIRIQGDYNYEKYLNEIKEGNAVDAAIKLWEDKYKELEKVRTNLFEQLRDIRGFSDDDKKNNKNPFAE